LPDAQYPLHLTTGRVLAHYQSGNQTRRVPALVSAEPEPFVEVHPLVARRCGLAEGDLARLRTRRGTATLRVRCNPTMRLDTVFVPFHWGGRGRANNLTTDALDRFSKIPEFKIAAAALEREPAPPGPEDAGAPDSGRPKGAARE